MVEHHPHDSLLAALDHHVDHVAKVDDAATKAAADHQAQLDREREQLKAAQQ